MNRTRRTLCRVYCVCVEGVGGGEDRRVFLPVRGRYKELHMMVWTFKSIDELLQCDHSNESYWAVLCCGAASMVYKEVTNFWVCGWNPKVWPFKWKYLSGTFQWRPQSQSEQYFHMILSPPLPHSRTVVQPYVPLILTSWQFWTMRLTCTKNGTHVNYF